MTTRELRTLPDGRMRPEEAAYMTGLAVKTLAMMRCNGTGPLYSKIRGRIWYHVDNVRSWLEKHPVQVSTAQDFKFNKQLKGEL